MINKELYKLFVRYRTKHNISDYNPEHQIPRAISRDPKYIEPSKVEKIVEKS